MFKRKIYSKLLSWKEESSGNTALLIEGARRIGKSTVVESFAKNEYQSYILIDFSTVSKSIKALFEDISDLDYLFLQLQLQYKVDLHERNPIDSSFTQSHVSPVPGFSFMYASNCMFSPYSARNAMPPLNITLESAVFPLFL